MGRFSFLKEHTKTIIILALCLCIPFITIWYIANNVNNNIFYEQKKESLLSFAKVLDTQLSEGGYEEILANAGMQDASREQQIEALNKALAEVTDEVAHSSDGLGVGFYSRKLDAILTYGPSVDYQQMVGVSIAEDHPGRRVMETGTADVSMGTMVRGNIMNAMQPIIRNGEVIGYIWANNLVSELEQTLSTTSRTILILLVISYLLMLVIIMMFIRKIVMTEERYTKALTDALEEAQSATHSKSSFLSSMSHEIRTPMNAIIGMTQIAAKTDDVTKLKYCLGNIENSSTHLLGIINDVLDISKIEAGKLELDSTPLNIEKMLIKVCNLMTERIELKNIKFNVSLGRDMRMHFIGDELRLSQVITNLLSNAVKFTPAGGSITLSSEEIAAEDNYSILRFSVEDTGIGMTKEQINSIFTAFQQAEISTTRRFGGTGLGLAISKNIVESMGGKIWVESVVDEGSTFIFEIKLERQQQQNNAVIFGNIKPSDIRLLIVDPDLEEREYFRSIITKFGMVADEVDTLSSAIDFAMNASAAHQPYDVVFCDYSLATDSNIELIRNSSFSITNNNVVMMTTFIDWNKIEDSLFSIGISRFIPKPLFPSSILNSINEIVSNNAKSVDISSGSSNQLPDFSRYRVLVAEDIEINREIAIALLEDTHINIDCAEDGQQALEMFNANQTGYDIILMDLQMPVMDGLESTRQIRALATPEALSIPIVAMTANAFAEDIAECKKAGMTDHIGKPLDADLFVEKLAAYLIGK
ncbi:MAG: response regulator [Oscillospiraceae bacterium]|nr:response regulator [Oscillospiraceae bacterium]